MKLSPLLSFILFSLVIDQATVTAYPWFRPNGKFVSKSKGNGGKGRNGKPKPTKAIVAPASDGGLIGASVNGDSSVCPAVSTETKVMYITVPIAPPVPTSRSLITAPSEVPAEATASTSPGTATIVHPGTSVIEQTKTVLVTITETAFATTTTVNNVETITATPPREDSLTAVTTTVPTISTFMTTKFTQVSQTKPLGTGIPAEFTSQGIATSVITMAPTVVTRTIMHEAQVTKTLTVTNTRDEIVTTTAVATLTSTEVQTVTVVPTPTTLVTTITHPPVTVTITQGGGTVVTSTVIETETATLTTAIQETTVSTVTEVQLTLSEAKTDSAADFTVKTTASTSVTTASESATESPSTTNPLTTSSTTAIESSTTNEGTATATSESSTTASISETTAITQSESSTTDLPSATPSDQTSSSASTTTTSSESLPTEDPQTSRRLDPRVIQDALFADGDPKDGQVPSLTSRNNFVNFCMTQPVPLTNGQQIKTGSCNPTPMGRILATDRIPAAAFLFPTNFGTIPANQGFTIQMKLKNLVSGNFVNAQKNYYGAPAQVDSTGTLIGHSHVVIEKIDSLQHATPTNPTIFAFFKGLNAAAVDGLLTADVTGGLPAGVYRIASINAAANHQPALISVAQHGSVDAFAYFTVV